MAKLVKKGKGCIASMVDADANDFTVPFPPNSDFTDRTLLLAAALFIDYMMFEDSPKKKN